MSVLSYLKTVASYAVLSPQEKDSIKTSILSLNNKLNYCLGVIEQLRFGSSTRETILPRSMDASSDIDYMVIFKDDSSTPQTYLNRLRRFAETYYPRSIIYQSSPTIKLELNHIQFDLVPATYSLAYSFLPQYNIPKGPSEWQLTNPNEYNRIFEEKNKHYSFLLKPTIRLVKYWNAKNGYLFDSFLLEKWILNRSFNFCYNHKDFLFKVFEDLAKTEFNTQSKKDKVLRAAKIISQVKYYEAQAWSYLAEEEIQKLIPPYK